jgi:hypothetical protein
MNDALLDPLSDFFVAPDFHREQAGVNLRVRSPCPASSPAIETSSSWAAQEGGGLALVSLVKGWANHKNMHWKIYALQFRLQTSLVRTEMGF